MNSNTLKLLGWNFGCIVTITALQKPFSFELLDQQMRKSSSHPETSINDLNNNKNVNKHRTSICQIEVSEKVEDNHIILPLQVRLQCLIEERTRTLVRYLYASPRKFKKIIPKKIQISEVRWIYHGNQR